MACWFGFILNFNVGCHEPMYLRNVDAIEECSGLTVCNMLHTLGTLNEVNNWSSFFCSLKNTLIDIHNAVAIKN